MSEGFATASEFVTSGYDSALERSFFGRVVLANGSFKTTAASRLDDVNQAALPYLRTLGRAISIKDVACSSGISTQEWKDSLVAAHVEATIVGTDISTRALHVPGKWLDLLLDANHNVIHLSIFGGAIHPRALKALRSVGLNALISRYIARGAEAFPMRLVSKAVRDVAIVDDDIADCSRVPSDSFDVIRAANILNLGYFDTTQLRLMVNHLRLGLREGGLLIICRTHDDGTNHATIFRHEQTRLAVIERLRSGSELEAILV